MISGGSWRQWIYLSGSLLAATATPASQIIRVATYNVENYLDAGIAGRPAKSAAAKARVREALHALNPDVVALQEMGTTNALEELRASLKAEGLDYPYWDYLAGAADTNIHIAVLSRLVLTDPCYHTNDAFLLDGRRFRVSRGFLELKVQANRAFHFTLIAAHLKSKRAVPQADESDLREQEGLLLREKVNARLSEDPGGDLIVLGDFNDTPNSRVIKTLVGRGRNVLVDTRPGERFAGGAPVSGAQGGSRPVCWTHYFPEADAYTRIDYILLSRALARKLKREETYVLAWPDWGLASDHRPVIAGFGVDDR